MADDVPTNATETPADTAAQKPEAATEETPAAEPTAEAAAAEKPAAEPAAEAAATEKLAAEPAAEAAATEKPAAEPAAEAAATEKPAAEPAAEAAATKKPAAKPEQAEPEKEPAPVPDPATCKAIAIGLPALGDGIDAGEWNDTDLEYYLEPAGILSGPLACTRAPENDPQRAGLLMTRAGWKAKTVFLDDGVNPETYELSFPKEFGYVKPLAHYIPETRKDAKYPWSKRY